MNYIKFSDKNYFLDNIFKEVGINEQCRIDAIIADVNYFNKRGGIYTDDARRSVLFNQFLELCKTQGQRFILFEISEDILYSESNEFHKIISWIQRETGCKFEFRCVCCQNFKEERQVDLFRYFLIFYYDNVFVFNDSCFAFCEKNYNINNSNNKYLNIIDYIFAKIKENLL